MNVRKIAKKFHDEVWFSRDEKGREGFKRRKKMMKELGQGMESHINEEFKSKYHFESSKPIGMGLSGFVYKSTLKGIVIKMSFHEIEAKAALRVKNKDYKRVAKVFAVVPVMMDKTQAYLIYLEALMQPKLKVRKCLEDLLHPAYSMKLDGSANVMAVLKNIEKVLTTASKDSTLRATARQVISALEELMKNKDWHVDMHADNWMSSSSGELKLVDVGGMGGKPLLERKERTAAPWDDHGCGDTLVEHLTLIPREIRKRLRLASMKYMGDGIDSAAFPCTDPKLIVRVTESIEVHKGAKQSARDSALSEFLPQVDKRTFKYNVKVSPVERVTMYFLYMEKLKSVPISLREAWYKFQDETDVFDRLDRSKAIKDEFKKCVSEVEVVNLPLSRSTSFKTLVGFLSSLIEAGYWHHDLWPENSNIMANASGKLRFIDIGSIGKIA